MAYSRFRIAALVQQTLERNPRTSLNQIAAQLHVERHTVQKAIVSMLGISFRAYQQRLLIDRAKALLAEDGTQSIKEIAYTLGFGSPRAFTRAVTRACHSTPSTLRRMISRTHVKFDVFLREGVLIDLRPLSPQTWHARISVHDERPFSFDAGQSVGIFAADSAQQNLRTYPIASYSHTAADAFDLCFRVGPADIVSTWLGSRRLNDRIGFCGPFGGFPWREMPSSSLLCVATGIAIAPMRSLLHRLLQHETSTANHRRHVWLLYGVRHERDILYRNEFEAIATEHPWFHFLPTLSRPTVEWPGHVGHVQDHVTRYLDIHPIPHVYVAGHESMIRDVLDTLEGVGCPAESIACHGGH